MIYVAFENEKNVKNFLRNRILKFGSGGEMVHVELYSTKYDVRMSAWHPQGVEIRTPINYNYNYELYAIDITDDLVLEYFKKRQGKKYNLGGLLYNMMLNLPSKKQKHFCSQICYDALLACGISLPKNLTETLSPQEFYLIIKSQFPQLQN